ncbi:MAG: type VI secretion system baseplate subunit TssF [Polyangiaceae bacterium]
MPILPRFDLRALTADALRFSEAFPAIAGRLGRPATDPSTERLVEGNNFLAATVLDKIEDFQTNAHEVLALRASPWLRRPLPAATIVAFEPSDVDRLVIPRATDLRSAAQDGVSCTFRPVASSMVSAYCVRSASLESRPGRAPVVRIVLESTAGAPVNELVCRGVSLYIDGELENALELVHAMTSGLEGATVTSDSWSETIHISSADVERGGLAPEESLAPDPDGLPSAFGVMTEAFVFPHRFRFVVVRGLGPCASAKPASRVTLTFVLRESMSPGAHLETGHVRPHCAAVTNLFDASAEPMPLDFERGPIPIRVAELPPSAGSVYAVREAWATATRGEHGPLPVPDVRRLAASRVAPGSPAAFATALERFGAEDPVMTIALTPLAAADERDLDRILSLRVLATNGARAGSLRSGDLAGTLDVAGRRVRFRNIVPSSPYVAPPLDGAFAQRAVRLAAAPTGRADLLASLRDSLFLAVPSWTGSPESVRAQHLRLEGLRAFEVTIARRLVAERATRHGYAYRLTVDESAFRGTGDLGLFGAALGEALSRSVPVNTFAELSVLGAKTGFRATYSPRSRA